ncbi:MAG TPA: hypothetical protein VGM73_09895 [Candidatus Didemnitutus sp.]|jgi:hypothetical protein
MEKNLAATLGMLVLFVGIVGGGLLLWRHDRSLARTAKEPDAGALVSAAEEPDRPWEIRVRAKKMGWLDVADYRGRWEAAVSTGDLKTWSPVLGELMNPKYRQADAVAMLGDMKSNDWRVKALAAQILLQRGSREGVATMVETLKAASAGENVPESVVLKAVVSLNRFGETIDPASLRGSYQRYPLDEILEVAALQGDAWAPAAVQQARQVGRPVIDTALDAAYLGMADDQSLAIYRQLVNSADPDLRAVGNWALYRATGDQATLQNVVEMARVYSGLDPAAGHAPGSSYSVGLLTATEDPKAAQTLEAIADLAAHRKAKGAYGVDETLSALYYVDKDYGFIDQRITSYLNGSDPDAKWGSAVFWQIAAVRSSPDIERLAYAKSPTAYDLYFVEMADYPIPRAQTPAVKAKSSHP